MGLMEEIMLDAGRRPMGRLCYWLLIVGSLGLAAFGAGAGPDSTPATTTVADTVYMADGTPAQGSLIISWPAFVTAGGAVVGAGTTSVTLGAHGALNVTLVPNAGATPWACITRWCTSWGRGRYGPNSGSFRQRLRRTWRRCGRRRDREWRRRRFRCNT